MAKRQLKIWLPTLVIAFLILGVHSPGYAADDPDTLVQAAWEANPSVLALEEKIEAANQKVPQAGVWNDPVIAVEYSNVPVDSFELGDHPMSGVQLKLQQTFPFPGKTAKRKKAAAALADVTAAKLAEKKNQVRGMVKRTYWSLTQSRHLKKITQRHIQELERLIASLTSRYEVGGAGQHELLRLTILRERLVDELAHFDQQDTALLAALNALLSRAPGAKIETPETVAPETVASSPQTAFQLAQEARPLVSVWNQQAKAHQLAAKQASHEGWPDPTIWAGYRLREQVVNDLGLVQDEGTDFFSAGLSFPIPLFNGSRWGAKKRESLANKRSAESTRRALLDEIQGELAKSYAGWNRSFDKAQTYLSVIVPGLKQARQATLAAYQVGRADFASLFAAEVELLDAKRALIRAQCETRIHQANVQTLVGDNVPVAKGQS